MNVELYRNRTEHDDAIVTRYIDPSLLKLEDRQFEETATSRIIRDVVVSTEDEDSHSSILRLSGWDLQRYAANPVLDWMHASTGYNRPSPDELIGQAFMKPTPTALAADLVFVPDDLSNIAGKVFRQMKAKILRGLSVSFLPRSWEWKLKLTDGTIIDQPDLSTDEGFFEFIRLMKAGARELLVVTKQELVAIGVVMVPSNPNTLSNSIAAHRCFKDDRREEAKRVAMGTGDRSPVRPSVRAKARGYRGAVAFKSYALSEESWDGDAAEGRIRAASTRQDGTVDWVAYQAGFAWFDESAPDVFASYKLPHHDVTDDGWTTVKAGVMAAGAAMQGARGGVDLPEADVESVREHLAAHYHEFDLKAPWETVEEPGAEGEAEAAEPQKGIDMTIEETNAAKEIPTTRTISEEARTEATKLGTVALSAIGAANAALEGTDEEAARKACEDAATACSKLNDAYKSILPVVVVEPGEEEEESVEEAVTEAVETRSVAWVHELTGHEDEPSQRGAIEAWKKSATELAEARALITKLQSENATIKAGTLEQQMRAILDGAERKITPAERVSYEDRHYVIDGETRTWNGTEKDIAWLRSHMAALPDRAELAAATEQAPRPTGDVLTDEERKIARQFGMTTEQFAEHKRALAARDGATETEDE